MKIYTKGGDKGKTGIHGGQRVDKDDIRIEANGTLDELNSLLGLIRALIGEEHEWQEMLFQLQRSLMAVMSHVATPAVLRAQNPNILPDDLDVYCEQQIDRLNEAIAYASAYFILPGGNLVSAQCHVARTVARRAERRLWSLNRQDEVPAIILRFVNRLSDLLFVMARYEMDKEGAEEERWQTFLYKKKKNCN